MSIPSAVFLAFGETVTNEHLGSAAVCTSAAKAGVEGGTAQPESRVDVAAETISNRRVAQGPSSDGAVGRRSTRCTDCV